MPEDNRSNQSNPSSAPGPESSESSAGNNTPADHGEGQAETQSRPTNQPENQPEEPERPSTSERRHPPAEEPTEPEMTPEEAEDKQLEILGQVVMDKNRHEKERLEHKYGKGKIGEIRRWLNEDKTGRVVKVIGKIALGTGAALGAGVIAGPSALILAPFLYTMGTKLAIDGGIEAVQKFSKKGREARLKLEAARQELSTPELTIKYEELLNKHETGEIDDAALADEILKFTEAIRNAEKEIASQEINEKNQAALRAKISTIGTVAVSVCMGVPLGLQNFDLNKTSHMVRIGFHGFQYIQHSGAHLWGAAGFGAKHVVMAGHAFQVGAYGVPLHAATNMARIGVGMAGIGLFAATAKELQEAKDRGWIESNYPDDPDYLKEAKKYKRRIVGNRATPPAGGASGQQPSSGPAEPAAGAQETATEQTTRESTPPAGENEKPGAAAGATETENVAESDTPEAIVGRLKEFLLRINGLLIEIRHRRGREKEELKRELDRMREEEEQFIFNKRLGLNDNSSPYWEWHRVWAKRSIALAVVQYYEGRQNLNDSEQRELDGNKNSLENTSAQADAADQEYLEELRKRKEGAAGEERAGGAAA